MDMHGKQIVITGGNSGIGKEAAVELARAGAEVFIAARDQQKGEAAVAEIRERSGNKEAWLTPLDLGSFESIRTCAAWLLDRLPRIDVLVCNAGAVLTTRQTTNEGFEATFGVNHLGHFLLTKLLLDRVVKSRPARIVVVASDAHRYARGGLDFDDLNAEKSFFGWEVYCKSKLANVYFANELARRLEGRGVVANSMHPGFVASNFAKDGDAGWLGSVGMVLLRPFAINTQKGARTIIHLASADEAGDISGKYWHKCKVVRPSRRAQDAEAAARLWTLSEEMVARA
jgi:NAD(P)-dependent dehydrogenase (short-subunit alcohol dehydrogenase family)